MEKWRLNFNVIYMGMPKNVGETISAEAVAEVEIMQELDRLFQEAEGETVNEERKIELAGEIRQALERYRKLFRQAIKEDDAARELFRGYYERLEKLEKDLSAAA